MDKATLPRGLVVALAALLLAGVLAPTVKAAGMQNGEEDDPQPEITVWDDGYTPTGDNGPAFFVRPWLPANQVDDTLGYFDLKVEPGSRQTLKVEVFNESSRPIEVRVRATTACTASDGSIDYLTDEKPDETMAVSFSRIAGVERARLRVPVGGSVLAQVEVAVPERDFQGAVLGGIVVEKIEGSGKEAKTGLCHVIGVHISQNGAETVEPEIELLGMESAEIEGGKAAVYTLRNCQPALAKKLEATVSVYRDGAGPPVLHQESELDMAPNSVMEMPLAFPKGGLAPGRYQSVIQVRSATNAWNMEEWFTVSDGGLGPLASFTVNQPLDRVSMWIVLLTIVPMTAAIVMPIVLRRRRRNTMDQ